MGEINSPPAISIITPLYNSSRYIEETLDSVRRQTYESWESILVDDGSTDDTAEKVKPFLKDARFKYLKQENQGIAGARNTGIKSARGEWICLLDHDDRWMPEKLERQLKFARSHSLDIICTDAVVIEGERRKLYSGHFPDVLAKVERSLHDAGVDVFDLLIGVDFLCASSVMIRKRLFDERGLLDVAAAPADDYEMWLRCMPQAKIGYLNEPLIEYVLHEHNYSNNQARMFEKGIFALSKTRRVLASSREHDTTFERSLTTLHYYLFKELRSARGYAAMLPHALKLLTGDAMSRRVLFKSTVKPPLVSLRSRLRRMVHIPDLPSARPK